MSASRVQVPFLADLLVLLLAREDAVRLRRLVNMESGKKSKNPAPEDEEEPDEHSGVDSFKQVSPHCSSVSTIDESATW